MRTKRSEVVSAALAFIQASDPLDEMFIVTFNDGVTFALEDEGFSNSVARLRRAILGLTCTGRTALYDGLAAALQHLEKGQYERKALLVVSDGRDNVSQRKFDEVLEMVQRSNAFVYTIALYDEENRERNKKVLERMSKAGGGEFFGPLLLTEIGEICRRIAKDIRNLYTLAYKPRETPHDGSYRVINVIVKTPGREKLIVRAHDGYFSPVRPKA